MNIYSNSKINNINNCIFDMNSARQKFLYDVHIIKYIMLTIFFTKTQTK